MSVQSLDINIIKNMWKIIKLHVQKELSAINSRQDSSDVNKARPLKAKATVPRPRPKPFHNAKAYDKR